MRPTAERCAREAAAAAADREAAMERRGQLTAVQSELRSLKAVAAAQVEEEREGEHRRGWPHWREKRLTLRTLVRLGLYWKCIGNIE